MIYKDNNEIGSVFYGSNEIDSIWYGNNEVWSSFKIIDLGTAKSFNVASVYSKYGSLTSSNFFALSCSTASGAISVHMRPSDPRESHGFYTKLVKSYNSSTGMLSFYNGIYDIDTLIGSANVHAVLVTKPSKLVHLGTSTSFSVTSYSGYRNFTANNFLIAGSSTIGTSNSFNPQDYEYSGVGSGSSVVTKSYNSTSGSLTSNIVLTAHNTDGTYHWFDYSYTGGLDIYLNTKV